MKVTTKRIVFTAMFAAIVFVGTRISIPAPFGSGYIHLGDSFIYLCAALLPMPYCAIAAALGAGFADVLSGFMIYVPATVVIKFLMACCFTDKSEKILNVRNGVMILAAGVVNVLGYFIYECFLYGIAGAAASIPSNIIQSVGGGVLFAVIALMLDKVGFKKTFSKL